MIQHLASGVPVCATVTELDGLVYSRDARYHSANYRCVMCFGRGRLVEDDDAEAVGVRGDDLALLPRAHRWTEITRSLPSLIWTRRRGRDRD